MATATTTTLTATIIATTAIITGTTIIATMPTILATTIIEELTADEPPSLAHDSSTNELIRRYRAGRGRPI